MRIQQETAKLTRYRSLFNSADEAMAEIDLTFAYVKARSHETGLVRLGPMKSHENSHPAR